MMGSKIRTGLYNYPRYKKYEHIPSSQKSTNCFNDLWAWIMSWYIKKK